MCTAGKFPQRPLNGAMFNPNLHCATGKENDCTENAGMWFCTEVNKCVIDPKAND